MTLDLTNPDHVNALRWACNIKADIDAGKIVTVATGGRSGKNTSALALATLSSPALAADLIRQLVERAGYHVDVEAVRGIPIGILYRVGPQARARIELEDVDGKVASSIPALIARLLAIPPNAGAAEVLKALRGET